MRKAEKQRVVPREFSDSLCAVVLWRRMSLTSTARVGKAGPVGTPRPLPPRPRSRWTESLDGTTGQCQLSLPVGGIIFQNTDYSFGDPHGPGGRHGRPLDGVEGAGVPFRPQCPLRRTLRADAAEEHRAEIPVAPIGNHRHHRAAIHLGRQVHGRRNGRPR